MVVLTVGTRSWWVQRIFFRLLLI